MTDDARPASPRDALDTLLAGNARFADGTPQHPNQSADARARRAAGQDPFAVVFGCSDSRVAAEIVFDRGLGDLFVVRTAGHVLGPEVAASIEFGVTALGAPLVVVLGHDRCGAVTATLDAHGSGRTPPGQLRVIVERLSPVVLAAQARGITDRDAVARLHVESTAERLLELSPPLRERVEAGACAVVGLSYALAEGRVDVVRGTGRPADGSASPDPRTTR